MKRLYLMFLITVLAATALTGEESEVNAQNNDKMTICHGTGSQSNQFVKIVVDAGSDNGHFNTDGTPRAGHESDILLSGDVDCPSGSSPTPTATPTPTPTATPISTPIPTATPASAGTTTTTTTGGTVLGAAATPTPVPAGQVLGAQVQQGEVLGAQTLAPTGVFDVLLSAALKIIGIVISGLGLAGYVKGTRA